MDANETGRNIVLETLHCLLLERLTHPQDGRAYHGLSGALVPIVENLPLNGRWTNAKAWLGIAKRRLKKAGLSGLYAALAAAEDGHAPRRKAAAVYRILFDPHDPALQRGIADADATYEALDQESRTAEEEGIPNAIAQTLERFLADNRIDDIDIELTPVTNRKMRIDGIKNTGVPGLGHASMVLRALCDACDRRKIMLTTLIEPADTDTARSAERLDDAAVMAWFARNGFRRLATTNRGRPVMTRPPARRDLSGVKDPHHGPMEISDHHDRS